MRNFLVKGEITPKLDLTAELLREPKLHRSTHVIDQL